MIKKLLSLLLAVVMITSIFCISSISADALSYKDKIINEIINKNLIKSYYNGYYFADLNLDGKNEFIEVNDSELSQCTVYYMKGSKLVSASGTFSGPRNKLYYDTEKQGYVWNASEIKLLRSGIYSFEMGSINNTFSCKNGKVSTNMYSFSQSVLVDEKTGKRQTSYYKGNPLAANSKASKISKEKYNSINKQIKKNYVNANAKIKVIETYELRNISKSKLKSLLSKSYDAFSYKKMPKLNHKTVTLKKGKTLSLKIENKKGKATFTTSNKKVATVSSKGVIKALKRGKATITVKNNGIKIKCSVSVK